jgi:hypothetical protein
MKRDAGDRVVAGLVTLVLGVGLILVPSVSAPAQNRPPLQEPIALEGTMKQFYKAANVIVVTTIDGVEHAYRFTRDLIVHGGKKPGVDALEDLEEGTTIVVHRTTSGPDAAIAEIDVVGGEGLKVTEGAVAGINRRKQEITLRYANGRTETLKLTPRAVSPSDARFDTSDGAVTHIVVYYVDDAGRKVAHFVKTEP